MIILGSGILCISRESATEWVLSSDGNAKRIAAVRELSPRRLVKFVLVQLEHARNLDRERRIKIHGDRFDLFLFHHLVQLEEKHLRSLDGKGRDEQGSAFRAGVLDRSFQHVAPHCAIFVHAVAVDAFHDKRIRPDGRLDIVQKRLRRIADVAGEDDRAIAAHQFDHHRAQNVPRVEQFHPDIPCLRRRAYLERLVVVMSAPKRESDVDIMLLIHRLAAVPLELISHDAERILEHYFAQILRRRRGKDRAAKAVTHQLRHAADVILMRVRDEKYVDRGGVVRERHQVLLVADLGGRILALERPTIYKYLLPCPKQSRGVGRIKEKIGPRDRARAAVKSNFCRHRRILAPKNPPFGGFFGAASTESLGLIPGGFPQQHAYSMKQLRIPYFTKQV